VKYAAIADWADAKLFPVGYMCTKLGVSRSGYYAWRTRPVSAHDLADAKLKALIQAIWARLNQPGVRRVRAELAVCGHKVSSKRVLRLMRELGLQGRHPRPWRRTTIPGAPAGAPDLIGRDFTAAGPNARWVGDITYVKTWRGWAYVATVIDLYSRRLVGWAIADHMRTSLVIDALHMAVTQRKPSKGVIFHSDRGTQYTSKEFSDWCQKHHVTRSLGRTGVCFDNAVAESFNATYKKELIHTRPWPTIRDLIKATFEWAETYYNTTRRHSTLGYLTPAEKELGYQQLADIAA